MTNEEIIAYLTHESRRTFINWTGIENKYFVDDKGNCIGKGRIKNVCLFKKGKFRNDEIEKLSKAIQDLQV